MTRLYREVFVGFEMAHVGVGLRIAMAKLGLTSNFDSRMGIFFALKEIKNDGYLRSMKAQTVILLI